MITKEQFESCSPYQRGYLVYIAGEREDEPNVPNENNPYEEGTSAWQDWNTGNFRAMLNVQDGEE